MSETYFSIDIETDGPAPGLNSMLSIGIAVFEQGTLTGTFSRNLELLPDAEQNEETMRWWSTQKQAWDICRSNPQDPTKVMRECAAFCEEFPDKRIAVGWPVAFDFAFVNWYFWRFVGRNPLGFGGMDLRSYVAGLNWHAGYLGIPAGEINQMAKDRMPEGLRRTLVPHEAISDAIEQGFLLVGALELARRYGLKEVASGGLR